VSPSKLHSRVVALFVALSATAADAVVGILEPSLDVGAAFVVDGVAVGDGALSGVRQPTQNTNAMIIHLMASLTSC